ncbi:LamG domain-containing protein [Candidatus Poribacteria bacterium]|nr:LamG domain-containing protein [Candidatus Poribacteria bacterium]
MISLKRFFVNEPIRSQVLISITGVLIILCCTTTSSAKIDPKQVVGIWLFDEGNGKTAKDLSGNDNDGELKEGAKWDDGQFGDAVIFDGKDDYVEIAPSPLFNPEKFTVTYWIYPTAVGGNNPAGKGSATLVIANGNPGDGGGANWWFEFWNAGNFEFKSCQAGCAAATTPLNKPGEWYFIAGIYNGTEYELYIDGEFKSKGPNKVGAPEKGLLIGSGLCPAGHGCDGGYFKGIVDDVAMFSDTLSEADLKTLMDEGVGKVLGVAPVEPVGKLTTTWSILKTR